MLRQRLCHNMLMLKRKRSKWLLIWYPVIGIALVNLVLQLIVFSQQTQALGRANWMIFAAALYVQFISYVVLVPAMQSFYAEAGIRLGFKRTLQLVVAGIGLGKVMPGGDYLFWRKMLRREPDGVGVTTQYTILYYSFIVPALIVVFVAFEIICLTLYNARLDPSLAGKFILIPVIFTATIVVVGVFYKFFHMRERIRAVASRHLGSAVISPWNIIRQRKISRATLAKFACGSLASWIIEGVTLYFCLRAMGQNPPPELAVFAFAFSRLFTLLPLFPGGVGETETAVTLFFAAYGYPVGSVLTATVIFRLITFWVPITAAAIIYAVFSAHTRAGRHKPKNGERTTT